MKRREQLTDGAMDSVFSALYPGDAARQPERYRQAIDAFEQAFGQRDNIRLFSAPGRSEVGGNHTDHQRGCVLAAAVTLDLIAVVSQREDDRICIHSAGHRPMSLSVNDLAPKPKEKNTSISLVRGIAGRLQSLGYRVGGFDAYITSEVPKGSGLSSSAAYSILLCTIFSCLFNGGKVHPTQQAIISKYAENHYFGKPSGLMDQLASSTGGFVMIDFLDPEKPVIEQVDCDPGKLGYAVCIVNARGSHANLTPEYAAVPMEMGRVAAFFGKEVLREVEENAFYAALPELRKQTGDRAVLRAMHFFDDNKRVPLETAALQKKDMGAFLKLINESGKSSFMLLQNVCPTDAKERSIALALALSEKLLSGRGAWRIHGGGFAGTIQAFVPLDMTERYIAEMERVFGEGCCYQLAIRPVGGVEIAPA